MDEFDAVIAKRLRMFAAGVSLLAIAFGCWVLFGWVFDVSIAKTIIPDQVAVKANTAFCFIVIGLALWLRSRLEPLSGALRMTVRLATLTVSAVGAISFAEFLTGWDPGFDQWLIRVGPEDAYGSVRAGLMSPVAAASFVLLGTALATVHTKNRGGRWWVQLCLIVVTVATIFGVLDFVLDAGNTHTYISPVTAFVLLMLAISIPLVELEYGLGRLFASDSSGGTLIRRLLPASIAVPIGLGWLRWRGEQAALFSGWAGVSLMIVGTAILLASIVIWTAHIADRTDRERFRAQGSNLRLAAIVNCSNEAIIGKTQEGIITSWNPGAESIYGYTAHEMIGQSVSGLIPAEHQEEFQEILERVKRGEQIHSYETERIRKDGTRITMSVAVAPIRDANGNLLGASTIARDITEQKRAQEEIKRASLYARSLIEASVDPLVTISKTGKIMDVNRATELATGFTREQLIGTDFSDYFTEPEKARAGYERVFAEETVHDYPLALRHRSGHIMEVLYNASVFRNERGGVEGVFAAARDITQQKRAQEEIKRASLYARSLIEASVDPLVTISKTGKIMDVNRATERATGFTREQLIGTDFSDYFTEPEKARAGYERVFAEETVHDYPLALRHRSGQIMEVLYNASVFRNERGGVEGVFAAARDVTERNQAERGLKLSEIRYRSLVTATSQIVWSTDASGKVAGDMPLWRSYTGATVKQILGGGWIDSLHPDDRERAADLWIRSVRNRSLYDTEYRIRRHDGEYRFFSVRGVPVPDDCGGIREWIGTCTDITERKHAEDALHSLNEELELRVQQRTAQLQAANQELESFTYSVSHDLRAPLRHISGFSKILSEDFSAVLPQEAQHLLQRIDEGTRRMGMLVDDLLNLGRVGRHEVRLQVAGLDSVLSEVLNDLQPETQNRRVEWKIGRLPYVECDPPLMKQVFQNLLSNALKFSRPREQAVIEVGCQEQNGTPIVFIRDNGVGFSMKYADKLFGVFQRLHRTEDFEGTGVGLATVQRIILKHGGRIWAEAELDKGATFYFTLNASECVPGKPTSQQEKNHESTRT